MPAERAGGRLKLGLRFGRSRDDHDSDGDKLMCFVRLQCLFCI